PRFFPQAAGLVFDYRESAITVGEAVQELTGFVSRRISETWRFQLFVLTGLSGSSPDRGAGVQFKRTM
ncbi:MAG: hypothetical protein OEQ14_18440, partial [Gammaproteobacteria bacterium]|nr:hypothetical protein [Gammaproteobacteria bacterium]